MKYFKVINSFYANCGYCGSTCHCTSHSYGYICSNHKELIVVEDRIGISIVSDDFEIEETRDNIETRLYDVKNRLLIFRLSKAFPINPGNFEHYVKRFKSLVAFS